MASSTAQPVHVHTTHAKYGHEWTTVDLHIYGINIIYDNAKKFFTCAKKPEFVKDLDKKSKKSSEYAPIPSEFDMDFFDALNPEDAHIPGGQAYRLIQHLDEAMTATSADDSATTDFVVALLRALDFAPNEAIIRTGKKFLFRTAAEKRHATADVCIVEGTNPLLIVQQDKSHVDSLGGDAAARLVAAAIAAYDEDSLYRAEYDLPPRDDFPPRRETQMIGIVMRGTWPTFFKIGVSPTPRDRLLLPGIQDCSTIIVAAYQPAVPRPQQRLKEGMKPLDNRKLLVNEFLRLKQLMLQTSGKPLIPPNAGIPVKNGSG